MVDLFGNIVNNSAASLVSQFQTPVPVARYMVSLIPKHAKSILEPTPGDGVIVQLLQGYEVTAPKDFFLLPAARFDCVVMNPPFSCRYTVLDNAPGDINTTGMRAGYYILKRCMHLSNHVIALMPWFTLTDSDVRLQYLKNYGIKSVTALPRKTFKYTRIQTCVIELEKGYRGPSEFKTFKF